MGQEACVVCPEAYSMASCCWELYFLIKIVLFSLALQVG